MKFNKRQSASGGLTASTVCNIPDVGEPRVYDVCCRTFLRDMYAPRYWRVSPGWLHHDNILRATDDVSFDVYHVTAL